MKERIEAGARALFVACFDPLDPQFRGMGRAIAEHPERPGLRWRAWDGHSLGPGRLPRNLIVAGHGSDTYPRLGDGAGRSLTPADISLATGSQLFLLGCYQGREDLRAEWARGAGLPRESVHGAEGETETLLSTLFILHLWREGAERAAGIFDAWALANRIIRPFFEEAREVYRKANGDPLAPLEYLSRVTDLGPVQPFLELARNQPQYLSGLLRADAP